MWFIDKHFGSILATVIIVTALIVDPFIGFICIGLYGFWKAITYD
jgi:hypothetical protein